MSRSATDIPLTARLAPTEENRDLLKRLFAPVDIASLVVFRILFGALMFAEICAFFYYGGISKFYIDPVLHFTYYGFNWVRPWPGNWMYLHFAVLGFLALCITVGFCYRIATPLYFLGWTYVFLLDQAQYRNHMYLFCLLTLLMSVVPAHRAFSVDARLRPSIRSDTVPAWCLWLLRAQIGIMYFFSGVIKLNGDWLRGSPMAMRLNDYMHIPLIGPLLAERWMAIVFSYGGLLLELFVVPLLLWKRTRLFAFLLLVSFHVLTHVLWRIGVFPWVSIACAMLFFPPDWPRRFLPHTGGKRLGQSAFLIPDRLRVGHYVVLGLLGAYLTVQALVPMRYLLYPGNRLWTGEAARFAWDMFIQAKKPGRVAFYITDPADPTLSYILDPHPAIRRRVLLEARRQTVPGTVPSEDAPPDPSSDDASGIQATVTPREFPPKLVLTARQYQLLYHRPDILLQYCHRIADVFRRRGHEQVQVWANVEVSLNGRKAQLWVDNRVDLAAQRRTLVPVSWLMPLTEPLPE